MKQVVIGIFAHPDDEAFGPSGSLLFKASDGWDVHIICATSGESGYNPGHSSDLGAVRKNELESACHLIGTKSVHCLGFGDGSLCNSQYAELSSRIQAVVIQIVNGCGDEDVKLELLTYEPHGLTGHLDHIAVSFVTTQVYHRLETKLLANLKQKQLKYFCLSEEQQPEPNIDYFVYMPPGYPVHFIDESTDVSKVYEQKLAIMRAHASQEDDLNVLLAQDDTLTKTENFIFYRS